MTARTQGAAESEGDDGDALRRVLAGRTKWVVAHTRGAGQ